MVGVTIDLSTPDVTDLAQIVDMLREWQREDAPIQLHPGDLGWFHRAGDHATAAALRVWRRDEAIVAIALVDGPDVLRLTVAPEVWRDDELARQIVADVFDQLAITNVEVPDGTSVQHRLDTTGWQRGEAWTPLHRDLRQPVDTTDLRVDIVSAHDVGEFTAVHRSAWNSRRFTDQAWQAMASGPAFADARCLLARNENGVVVAGVTIWSAGAGRPGLLEPLGVHAEHRGRGYARALCLTAAAELQELDASSVLVCTPTSLTSAVATYRSAGFAELPQRLDRTRAV